MPTKAKRKIKRKPHSVIRFMRRFADGSLMYDTFRSPADAQEGVIGGAEVVRVRIIEEPNHA